MKKIIIIGGGPVGMSAALCLSSYGIESILIEKHATTTDHPKARGINARTMELLRLWGLSDNLKQYQMSRDAYCFAWIENFQEKEITRIQATVDYKPYSPVENTIIAQDDLERELLKKIQNNTLIELRFNAEMISITENNDECVKVEILDNNTGLIESICGHYLIGADGANSKVRKLINVTMEGVENLGVFCNIYCEMDLDKYVKHRPAAAFMFTKDDIRGAFILAKKELRKWLVGIRLGESLTRESFTDEFCVDYVKNIINDPQVDITLLISHFGPWQH